VILKHQLKNIKLVTTLQKKENCGTDAEVAGLGCTRSVAGGTSLMVTCVTYGLKCPVFLMQYWVVFIAETLFFVVMQFLMVFV
jgi:hypothetical protein